VVSGEGWTVRVTADRPDLGIRAGDRVYMEAGEAHLIRTLTQEEAARLLAGADPRPYADRVTERAVHIGAALARLGGGRGGEA
jgi:quercetin dioxygenase-like cupin family protein